MRARRSGSSNGLPAVGLEHLDEQIGVIAHDSVDPSRKEAFHVGAIVDRPDMDRHIDTLGGCEQIDTPAS